MIAWPVLRAIWWWTPEIGLTGGPGLRLGRARRPHHPATSGSPPSSSSSASPPPSSRSATASSPRSWCLVTRHRIRTCFSEFIITNRTGSLPLILWARPTPVGERVWIWLRPGLSLDDLQNRLDQIAVACWANTALAEIRLPVQRRVRSGWTSSAATC